MGAIKATPQVDQKGNQSGNTLIEITYGGNEAPFGGLDASAPPQYIDPNCFAAANGFVVSSKRLIAAGWFPLNITLVGFAPSGLYLGAGTYYANGKYYNWCLGYTFSRVIGPPNYTDITYNLWVWPAGTVGNIPLTASVDSIEYDSATSAIAATAQLGISGPPSIATDTGDIFVYINGIAVDTSIVIGNSPANIATTMAGDIMANGTLAALLTATAVGNVVNLVANTPGAAGNGITLSIRNPTNPGVQHANVTQVFSGGADATSGQQFGTPLIPLSWVAIGEILYFGGPGSVILQFQNTPATGPQLTVLTNYLGAVTLNKFGGFLIAGGVVPGQTLIIDAPEMVIAWSANGAYGIWNAENPDGTVTGAGFNEIADLSDYITGMFITNSIAIVLHTQGIDYLTLTGSGASPFDFNHISNSKSGEGCQTSQLNTQYDQLGYFVGNSDIYEYANGLKPIGSKIKQILLPGIQGSTALACLATQFSIDDTTIDVFVFFLIGPNLFIYNGDDKVWMQDTFINFGGRIGPYDLVAFSANATGGLVTQFVNEKLPIMIALSDLIPKFYEFRPFIQNIDFPYVPTDGSSFVTFPSEEIDFGKDIVIDGIYVALIGTPDQVVTFNVTGQLRGQTVFSSAQIQLGTEADGVTIRHYKVYFSGVSIHGIPPLTVGAGTFVGKNPQLTISLNTASSEAQLPFQIIKVKMFGSFDPSQRPI